MKLDVSQNNQRSVRMSLAQSVVYTKLKFTSQPQKQFLKFDSRFRLHKLDIKVIIYRFNCLDYCEKTLHLNGGEYSMTYNCIKTYI